MANAFNDNFYLFVTNFHYLYSNLLIGIHWVEYKNKEIKNIVLDTYFHSVHILGWQLSH